MNPSHSLRDSSILLNKKYVLLLLPEEHVDFFILPTFYVVSFGRECGGERSNSSHPSP
jgi:hypothetical protein